MQKLSDLVARRTLLAAKLAKAKAARDAALDARQHHLLEGDIDGGDGKIGTSLQQKCESSESSLAGIEAALASLATSITAAQANVDHENLLAARKVASEALAADLKVVGNMIGPFLKYARECAAAYAKLERVSFEAGAISRYANDAATQIELGGATVLVDVANCVRAIAEGHQAIPKEPEAPVAAIKISKPETKTIFTTVAIKWATDTGQRKVGKWQDIELPLALAEKALKLGAAVLVSDALRRQHGGKVENRPAPDHLSIDLDHATSLQFCEPAPRQTYLQAHRGASYKMHIGG